MPSDSASYVSVGGECSETRQPEVRGRTPAAAARSPAADPEAGRAEAPPAAAPQPPPNKYGVASQPAGARSGPTPTHPPTHPPAHLSLDLLGDGPSHVGRPLVIVAGSGSGWCLGCPSPDRPCSHRLLIRLGRVVLSQADGQDRHTTTKVKVRRRHSTAKKGLPFGVDIASTERVYKEAFFFYFSSNFLMEDVFVFH